MRFLARGYRYVLGKLLAVHTIRGQANGICSNICSNFLSNTRNPLPDLDVDSGSGTKSSEWPIKQMRLLLSTGKFEQSFLRGSGLYRLPI